MKRVGKSGVGYAQTPAAYVSGNPTLQLPNETASTAGSKTHKVVQPYSNRQGAFAGSDRVAFNFDPDDNRIVQGKMVDLSAFKLDSDYFMGLRPVEPGNTLLLTANNEQSTTNSTFTDVKRMQITRPGKYRIKCELSISAGVAEARVVRKLKDGTVVVVVASSVTENSVTYPTFGSTKTMDMTSPVDWGDVLYIQLLNQVGGNTAYIRNTTINYQDASAALGVYDSVIVD